MWKKSREVKKQTSSLLKNLKYKDYESRLIRNEKASVNKKCDDNKSKPNSFFSWLLKKIKKLYRYDEFMDDLKNSEQELKELGWIEFYKRRWLTLTLFFIIVLYFIFGE